MTDRISEWGPMQKSDPVAVRIEDVGQALGRTSAHELGHSLGLVAVLETASANGWTAVTGATIATLSMQPIPRQIGSTTAGISWTPT